MKISRETSQRLFLSCTMLLPGPAGWLLYKALLLASPGMALGLYAEHKAIAGVIATFAFTMSGFAATIITLMFHYCDSNVFRRYKKAGRLRLFLFFYQNSMFWLMFTCLMAVLSYTNAAPPVGNWIFTLAFWSFLNNIVHIFLVSFTIYRMAQRASAEEANPREF